ncbi:hypothetical protein A4D02_15765 [Niastella koreensis]|uniref:Uncharacterized protein n=2 Tax=Niastella koreensis TaxID=354356 RepID=G8TPJ8_NIAKG|nr:hypothetical protein [Niastella koreensis]AEV97819.1 hypothetical protein Niako_1448 [Niastella koreensis GR20-10]OQP40371.1 hypothetical protein A4D02_15765 [Niastella koreensis]
MNKLILLFIFLASDSYGYSQLTARQTRDTSWYVVLKDSTVLYSKKLWVRYSDKEGDYLLLDYNKKIPMTEVARYRNSTGDYIRMKGPVETYRIEKGGPRLFVYSREFTFSDTAGFHRGNDFFIRKGPDGDMREMNYKNLKDALAGNAASMRQLQAARSTLVTGGIIGATGLLLTVIGGVQLFRQDRGHTLPPPPSLRDLQAGRLPTQPALPPKKPVPALAIAGPVIMIGAMVYLFTAPGHINKAINIYNQ